jgi:hypothetical protein
MLPFLNLSTDRALAPTAGAEGSAGYEVLYTDVAPKALIGNERDKRRIAVRVVMGREIHKLSPSRLNALHEFALEAMGVPTLPPPRIPSSFVNNDPEAQLVYDLNETLLQAQRALKAITDLDIENRQEISKRSSGWAPSYVEKSILAGNKLRIESAKRDVIEATRPLRRAWYNAVIGGNNLYADFNHMNHPQTMLNISDFVCKCLLVIGKHNFEADDAVISSITPRVQGRVTVPTTDANPGNPRWIARNCRAIHTAIWAGRTEIVRYMCRNLYPGPPLVNMEAPLSLTAALLVGGRPPITLSPSPWAEFVANFLSESARQGGNPGEVNMLLFLSIQVRECKLSVDAGIRARAEAAGQQPSSPSY